MFNMDNKKHTTKLNDVLSLNTRFRDLFNLNDIQHIQDLFAEIHGVASIITDPEGKPITQPSKFTYLCQNIIRKTKIGCENCFHSDAIIGSYNPKGAVVQPCLSGGLWDAGVSITVGGQHIANWLIGQVRNKQLDNEKILKYAEEIGADKNEFEMALKKVPIMSEEHFRKISDFLFVFANQICQIAYKNLQLNDEINERIKVENELHLFEKRNSMIIETAMDGFWRVNSNGKILEVNESMCNLTGYSEAELLTMYVWDVELNENKEDVKKHIEFIQKEKKHHFETKHRCKNGSIIDLEVSLQVYNKNIDEVVAFFRDITERKKNEIRLIEKEKQLSKKTQELEYLNSFFVNRELRMYELKNEINQLMEELGKEKKYI